MLHSLYKDTRLGLSNLRLLESKRFIPYQPKQHPCPLFQIMEHLTIVTNNGLTSPTSAYLVLMSMKPWISNDRQAEISAGGYLVRSVPGENIEAFAQAYNQSSLTIQQMS